ncbi:unnamed protein product [Protopolystoma xenopodis]|uniref:Uncharacterized protein n=1 Tax=Protopolystoma xenopodis TaxID=117903 RepID=A0A3S5ASK0_9PLAT|nr:unnamed protein product [Protopolystoma xenopodis]
MKSRPQHPAFYRSRRHIWPTSSSESSSGWASRVCPSPARSNCNELWKVWQAVGLLLGVGWLCTIGLQRYLQVKAQAYHPRFGLAWDEGFTLNLQLACLLAGLSLVPGLVYTLTVKTSHCANDSVLLGQDTRHLHNLSAVAAAFRAISRSDRTDLAHTDASSAGWVCPTSTLLPPPPPPPSFSSYPPPPPPSSFSNGHLSAAWQASDEEEIGHLLLLSQHNGCLARLRRHVRPFSLLIFLCIVYLFLTPVVFLEAEQIKHEAIEPRKSGPIPPS